ncbi:stage II sporulation protein M [Brevibacillus ruminantium]|uniref:Stage II sporulation protein M n=1 Tax=Brevibacillus ruminantium TaxID=2950604 RepID=A0ABY4WKY7_9BACL|nr:stage II sporulation protein M [Brevibacillus ruminantium]USG67698.1 stage II sporulation protein M [Brevibacillus ruminantium]
MNLTSFWQSHKATWAELDRLLEHFQKRPRQVGAAEIDRLTLLYKKTSAHLAYIRTYHPHDEITQYLNQLVSRAHNTAYRQQSNSMGQLSHFFWVHLFSLVNKRIWFIGLAGLLFVIGGISGFAAVMVDPLNLYYVLPEGMAAHIDPSRLGAGHDAINSPIMSTAIMINNIKVAFLAFISGITLGLVPVYLMLYNGLLVGALAAVYAQADSSYAFWAYILPHGVIELTAIFIAGGAGLHMGYRLLVPGIYHRKYQFLQAAKESAQLLLGTLPMFVIAGIIEGYITPSSFSLEAKYSVAALTLLALVGWYLYGFYRQRQRS